MLLAKSAILLLWFAAVFDPIGEVYYLRYIALGAAAVALVGLCVDGARFGLEISHRVGFILMAAIVMPLHGLLLYSFHSGAAKLIDTSYISSGALIATSLLYRNYEMCRLGINAFLGATRLLSVIVIAALISQVASSGEWIRFFTERSVALVSFREYSGIIFPYIYFLASPLLILLLAYDYSRLLANKNVTNLCLFLITSVALFSSGTRAHMVLAILFVPLYALLHGGVKNVAKTASLVGMTAPFLLLSNEYWSTIAAFFSASETSNLMKLSLLGGYAEIFSQPIVLLFGQGFNAHEWSPPVREMIALDLNASKTELTYLELIRVFGLGITVVFCSLLVSVIWSSRQLPRDTSWIYPGFAIYLLNATINPYLFSVNGMLPLGLFASIVFYVKGGTQRKSSPRDPLVRGTNTAVK